MADNKNQNLIFEDAKAVVEKTVSNLIETFGNGVELVDIKYFKEYGKFNITVYIWKKEGISLNDCEAIHNVVSPALDEFDDFFPEEYVLNISSMGLDRQIVSDNDLRRALDTEIEIFLDDKSKTHGVLEKYSDEFITIRIGVNNSQSKSICKKNITKVQPYIRF